MNELDLRKTIYWAKNRPDAIIPSKEKEDAGYDLYATFDEKLIVIDPFKTVAIPTGLSWVCNSNYYLQIAERSSTGMKGMKVSCGVIDSGYRGEIKVAIYNANNIPLVLSPYSEEVVNKTLSENFDKYKVDINNYIFHLTSKAIAQGIVHRVEDFDTKEVSLEYLQRIPSKRGLGGFGSSNK